MSAKKNVLITDSLFIFDEHIQKFEASGITVTRLDKPMASEAELIDAIKGKHGYILGGIEKVSGKVIDSADCLEALIFTGADWLSYIPGYVEATQKGVAIANCPGANARAVAEYALTLMLSMQRQIFSLGRTGKESFKTVRGLLDCHIGIIGMGTIGATVAGMLKGIGVKQVSYYSKRRKPQIEEALGVNYMDMMDLLAACDVVSLHTSKAAGVGYIGANQLAVLKDGALLVDTSFHGSVDADALLDQLKSGRIRAAYDHIPAQSFKELPAESFYYSNESTAFNTKEANQLASDMACATMLNLLAGKGDSHVVNGIKV